MSAALTPHDVLTAAEAKGFKVDYRTRRMQCPAHRGADLNCTVNPGTKGADVVITCQSHGCEYKDIVAALGLEAQPERSQSAQPRASAPKPTRATITKTYDYHDATGALIYQTVRTDPKDFFQRRPRERGGWVNNLQGVEAVPYRLPELLASDDIVIVVEGEKDVDNLRELGFVATCNHGGAGKWSTVHAKYLAGRDVAVIPDNDEAGTKHAAKVIESLYSVANSIRCNLLECVPPRDGVHTYEPMPEKSDVSDWLSMGGTVKQLRALIETTMPWERPKPEDGASLLSDVVRFLSRFVAYPSEAAMIAHALWIAHTHLMNVWDSTPRLAFLSPEPGSGKTRALEVSELLVPRPVEAVNMSAAALFRKVAGDDGLPTILFDEVDTVFGTKRVQESNEDVRGLLNAGHRRGAKSYRCVMRGKEIDVVEFEAFSAVALAGLGDLPDTILSRSVIVRMRRRAPNERVEPFRRRLEVKAGHELRDRLVTWARVVEGSIGNPWPQLPRGIEDRDADVWEGLIAIADAAGGDWPQRARTAAVELVAAAKDSSPSLGVRLLEDLRTVFRDLDAISSETLVFKLNALEEAPWAEINGAGKPLNARGLSQRLRQFGVKSRTIRLGDATPRGYRREELIDAWSRYLPSSEKSATSATSATNPENPSNHADSSVALFELHSATVAQHRNGSATENPSNGADVADVADVADFPAHEEAAIADHLQRMPAGELTDEERETLNSWSPLLTGEPGANRYTY